MVKICRVKQSTRKSKKRRGFCIKKEDVDNVVNNGLNTSFSDVNTIADAVNIVNNDDDASTSFTASAKKIQPIEASSPTAHESITGYRIVDMEILSSVFSLLSCPSCDGKSVFNLSDIVSERKGLASHLLLKCKMCSYSHEFYTSRSNDCSFDINKRIVYSMRACGQGHAGIETFTSLMNMPRPMTANNYDKIICCY